VSADHLIDVLSVIYDPLYEVLHQRIQGHGGIILETILSLLKDQQRIHPSNLSFVQDVNCSLSGLAARRHN
jgi:hypothetical protein